MRNTATAAAAADARRTARRTAVLGMAVSGKRLALHERATRPRDLRRLGRSAKRRGELLLEELRDAAFAPEPGKERAGDEPQVAASGGDFQRDGGIRPGGFAGKARGGDERIVLGIEQQQ